MENLDLKQLIKDVIEFLQSFFARIAEAFGQIEFGRGFEEVGGLFPEITDNRSAE